MGEPSNRDTSIVFSEVLSDAPEAQPKIPYKWPETSNRKKKGPLGVFPLYLVVQESSSDAAHDTSDEPHDLEPETADEPGNADEPGTADEPGNADEPGTADEPDNTDEPGMADEPETADEDESPEDADTSGSSPLHSVNGAAAAFLALFMAGANYQ